MFSYGVFRSLMTLGEEVEKMSPFNTTLPTPVLPVESPEVS